MGGRFQTEKGAKATKLGASATTQHNFEIEKTRIAFLEPTKLHWAAVTFLPVCGLAFS